MMHSLRCAGARPGLGLTWHAIPSAGPCSLPPLAFPFLTPGWRSATSSSPCCASKQSGEAPTRESTASPPPPQRPPRFYVETPLAASGAGFLVILPPTEAHHASRTLRMREGDALEVCDGAGGVAPAELAGPATKGGAFARLTAPPNLAPREPWEWTLVVACGGLKGGRGDWLVEKAAELGATALLPLLTVRSPSIGGADRGEERKGGKKRGKKEEGEGEGVTGREGRWQRVATAAMKQCLRPRALRIEGPCDVEELCARIQGCDVAWVGTEGAPPIQTAAAAVAAADVAAGDAPRQGYLIIGPEGDFTANEVAQMAAAGVRGVGLGPLRLRTETAAVAALAYARMAFLTVTD